MNKLNAIVLFVAFVIINVSSDSSNDQCKEDPDKTKRHDKLSESLKIFARLYCGLYIDHVILKLFIFIYCREKPGL